MIYKKILVTLLMSTFILSAQAMNNEKDDDFFKQYTLDRSEKIVLKKNYKEEKDDEYIDDFNVENLNNSKGSNSGSNFSDDFKELEKFHNYIGANTHSNSNWEDLKKEYLDNISPYIKKILFDENSFFYKNIVYTSKSNGNYSKQSINNVLSQIHALAILAFDESILIKKGCSANNIGTYRHTFCAHFLRNIQYQGYLDFLAIEKSYLDKQPVTGGKGSVRPDVYWPDIGHVFDFKFLGARVKNIDAILWNKHILEYKTFDEIYES